jgi:hypothetical protein
VGVSGSFLSCFASISVLYPLESAHQCYKLNILLMMSLRSFLQETVRPAETRLQLSASSLASSQGSVRKRKIVREFS